MTGQVVPDVVRCEYCRKPFDKRTTLKRHTYYCRSRKEGGTVRLRSCGACVKAKVRCDNLRPDCTRCKTKDLGCQYPAAAKILKERALPRDPKKAATQITPSIPADDTPSEIAPHVNNDYTFIDNDGFDNTYARHTSLGPTITGKDHTESSKFIDQFIAGEPFETAFHDSLSFPSFDIMHMQQPSFLGNTFSLPMQLTGSARSIIPRSGPQRVQKLITRTLRSYPRMMLQTEGPPPFIHPQSVSAGAGIGDDESLSNCRSLMHMVGNGVTANSKLFWRNVRLECERLRDVFQTLSRWELLGALQALAVYLIIRLDEGETEFNNCDQLMSSTVAMLSQHFNMYFRMPSAPPDSFAKPDRQDWIFEESSRRLCVLYQIINMLVYWEPAGLCNIQKNLILAPLPAKRRLWEATDDATWRLESEKEPSMDKTFALTSSGDVYKFGGETNRDMGILLCHESSDIRDDSKSTADWDEWCTGMDGFGGLVMLAASLIS